MHSVFTPALGSVTHVAYDGVTPTTVRFSATLNRADYYDLKRSGGTVQVWTDIPVQGKGKGKWDAISLSEASTSRSIEATLVDDVPELSLVSVQEELEEEEGRLSSGKTLSKSVQLEGDFILGSYSFTYRISYPSGGIRWLGNYGHNGVFVLERVAANRVGSNIDLEPGWTKTSGWVLDVDDEVTVGKVSGADKFKIWAIGKDGAPDASLQQAALLLLLPRPSHDTSVVPLTSTLLVASGETVLSLRPDGSLIASGKGTVYAQAPADYNLERVLSLHSSLQFKVLSASADHNHGCITHFVREEGSSPQTTYGLAFPSSSSSSSTFSVDLEPSAFGNPESALYSSASHQARLLSSSPKLRISANSIGGSFVVAPSYPITPSTNVVLTSAHVPSNPSVELPTPPPSPPLVMRDFRPRLVDNLSHPQPESTFQGFPEPPKEILVETPTPGEAAPELVPPPVEQVSSAPEPPKEAEDPPLQEVASPRTELVSAVNVWREKGIVSFVEHLTRVFMVVIIAMLFRRGAVSSHHKASAKPKVSEKVEKVDAQPPYPSQHSVSEATQSPEDLETHSEAGTEDTVVDGPAADPPLPQVEAAASEVIPILVKGHRHVVPAAYFDVPLGAAHLLLFTQSSKAVTLELDGVAVDSHLAEIGEGVYETTIKTGVAAENRSTFKLKVGLNESL